MALNLTSLNKELLCSLFWKETTTYTLLSKSQMVFACDSNCFDVTCSISSRLLVLYNAVPLDVVGYVDLFMYSAQQI